MAGIINLGAQSALRVTNHGILEIYAAFRHMRGDPTSRCLVLGAVPDTRRV
jgi:hypothetical protein